MHIDMKEQAVDYLNMDQPFGPIDAGSIKSTEMHELLFEHHNKLYKSLKENPSIVIGRKGSGKTSYLKSVLFGDKYQYVIELQTAEALTNVIHSIGEVATGPTFAENTAKLWDRILYIWLFNEIRKQLPSSSQAKKLINDYLAKIGIRSEGTIDDAVWAITEIISSQAEGKTTGIIAAIIRQFDNNTFEKTKETLFQELRESNKKAIILLDSLENFQLEFVQAETALQGLLKFVGKSNTSSDPVHCRLCLPAELYHKFFNISSNPIKDFQRRTILHWVASELIMVAAHRFNMYLKLNSIQHSYNTRDTFDEKGAAKSLLESTLPTKVTCRLGVEEKPLAYILRHTQLLPRHLIMLMNAIHEQQKRLGSKDNLALSEDAIRKGINSVEGTIVEEILIAFKPIYPHAKDVCQRCLPELHNKFSEGDLEKVFRTHGKKSMGTNEFYDFKRMLIEMGIIGRVLDDEGRYIKALFEYTLPHKLSSSSDDMLCIHPLFAETYSSKIRVKKPVYPYGSMIEDKDYRDDYNISRQYNKSFEIEAAV